MIFQPKQKYSGGGSQPWGQMHGHEKLCSDTSSVQNSDSRESMQMSPEQLREEIWAIICPEPDETGSPVSLPPHQRLHDHFGLDVSYFSPTWSTSGDRTYEHIVDDPADPLHKILESISVPAALFEASLRLFAESLIDYSSRDRTWGEYRYFPSILMTIWAAFESWVRITSELFINVSAHVEPVVANTLMEVRPIIKKDGRIGKGQDHQSTLMRYWLLLKYACNIEYNRGNQIWQNGEGVVRARDKLVHYHTSEGPTLDMPQVWKYMEAVLLLLIGPSTEAKRTLFRRQYEYHWMLVELQRFITVFEERPVHKGWAPSASVVYCPFDSVDAKRYRRHWVVPGSSKGS